jgi:putative peptide zinc metalloprotease protein
MSHTHPTEEIIPWRMRDDLEVFHADHVRSGWTIKDPVRLSYFRVESEELAFLQMLDGQKPLEQIIDQLRIRFRDQRFSSQNLVMFLATAIRSGLLVSTGTGYGRHLASIADKAESSAVYRKLFSLISHRFRGIDPSRLLHAIDRRLGWIYHKMVLRSAALFVVLATLLVLLQWDRLKSELPAISELFTLQNAMLLGVAIVCIKVVHEIGHGLTCYHYGGECHELGCIVVGFLPLLYCDVSDSWKEDSRTRRMQVAGAGIAVELFLAAVCGMLWLASVPGLIHSLFLNVMLVCSLNTILVNGNPLLRYDGYYLLSDALHLPNLGPQSRQAAMDIFDRAVLGIRRPSVTLTSVMQRIGMPVFGVASMVYRLLVLATILIVMHSVLKPYRLEPITVVLAMSAGSGVLLALVRTIQQRFNLVKNSGQQSLRAAVGMTLLTASCGLLLFRPMPYSIDAPFTLTPGTSSPVYVATEGRLKDSIPYGADIQPGQVIALLQNTELALSIVQLEGDLKLQEARLAHLESSRTASTKSAMAIPATRQAAQNIRERLLTTNRKVSRLNLLSPLAGDLLPPRSRKQSEHSAFEQHSWEGRPLDKHNRSAWMEEQTLLGWVGTRQNLRATVYIAQQDIEYVQAESVVNLEFHSQPASPVAGVVATLSSQPETHAPPELTASGKLAASVTGKLSDTRYLAHVKLNATSEPVPPLYSTGFATIRCQPKSIASRCWRLLTHTFAFEL